MDISRTGFVFMVKFVAKLTAEAVCELWNLARRIGRSIGAILVEQHTNITEGDVAGWLPQRVAAGFFP